MVVDVDAHYLEPIDEMADYMDEVWAKRVRAVSSDRLIPLTLGDRMLQGRIKRDDVDYGYNWGVMTRDQVMGVMDRLGVDATILLANRLVSIGHMSMRDLVVVLAEAYIDYMLDRVADPANGIYTMPVLPWQDPEAATRIIEKVGGHSAVVGACLMTSGPRPPLGDVRYDPIYEAAQHFNLPIVFHGVPGLTLIEGASFADGFQKLIEAHSLGFSVANMVQLTSVLLQGVPERFPNLRFVFQESGVFWVPMMMYRLDEYFLKRREEAPLLKELPSEYILDRFYFGTQPLESPKKTRFLESIFEMANGQEHFLFSTDYPHFDYDDSVVILRLPFLSREEKQQVLGGNAMRVFDFRKGGLQPWENTSSEAPPTSQREREESSK